jgi:hypothetical protein
MKNGERHDSLLTPFRIEEAKINEVVAESEKYSERVIREQEKVRDTKKAEREKGQAIVEGMITEFETLESRLEGEELKRLDAQGLTKKLLGDGQISGAEYFQKGITDKEAMKRAQADASEKLADLRNAVREKAFKVLEIEDAEAAAAFEIAFASSYPAVTMRERLKSLVASLEASLNSPIGLGGMLASQSISHAKHEKLQIATRGYMNGTGSGWIDYDLAGLKKLRFNPCFPVDQLPELEKIIAEAKTTGRGVRLQVTRCDGKNVLSLMWE